jgi:hypothetical protein
VQHRPEVRVQLEAGELLLVSDPPRLLLYLERGSRRRKLGQLTCDDPAEVEALLANLDPLRPLTDFKSDPGPLEPFQPPPEERR